jgi:hypothetical protein
MAPRWTAWGCTRGGAGGVGRGGGVGGGGGGGGGGVWVVGGGCGSRVVYLLVGFGVWFGCGSWWGGGLGSSGLYLIFCSVPCLLWVLRVSGLFALGGGVVLVVWRVCLPLVVRLVSVFSRRSVMRFVASSSSLCVSLAGPEGYRAGARRGRAVPRGRGSVCGFRATRVSVAVGVNGSQGRDGRRLCVCRRVGGVPASGEQHLVGPVGRAPGSRAFLRAPCRADVTAILVPLRLVRRQRRFDRTDRSRRRCCSGPTMDCWRSARHSYHRQYAYGRPKGQTGISFISRRMLGYGSLGGAAGLGKCPAGLRPPLWSRYGTAQQMVFADDGRSRMFSDTWNRRKLRRSVQRSSTGIGGFRSVRAPLRL